MLRDIQQSYHRWHVQSDAVNRWKAKGKKAFGYMCNHIPEELLYAGEILPVKLLGDSIPVVEANQYQSVFMCYYGRSLLEMGLQGAYSNLDGMVAAYGCEGGCNLFQVLVEAVSPEYNEFISIPRNARNDLASEFFTEELEKMKQSIEKYIGREITAGELAGAIDVYNENRQLLRQVYDARGLYDRPVLTGIEVAEIMNWAAEVPKDEANVQLRQLLDKAANRLLPPVCGPRIHISGSVLLDQDIFQLIEDLGGMVVSDDLCSGSRYIWDDIEVQEAQTTDDLLKSMAKQKLEKVPCSCMCSPYVAEERVEHILRLVKRYHVNGVIFAVHKWCDSHQMDRPFMIRRLQELGLPVLSIDVERGVGDAQARNRIESFLEMIGGNERVVHQDR